MIPVRLSLKNFLSYGSEIQTIDFTPYNLICLSGKNGHGKSALLDAITWALWGQARKMAGASRADESLLRLSQRHMLVVFEFLCNGTQYRIKREFLKNQQKSQATLEFGLLKSDGSCVSFTGKTIKETQNIIEKTIRIDFETFINSAFLRQGASNEFSKKNAKERKDILATILSLAQLEELKERALVKVREARVRLETLEIIQQKRTTELEKSSASLSSYEAIVQQLKDHCKKEDDCVKQILALRTESESVAYQTIQLQELIAAGETIIATRSIVMQKITELRKQFSVVQQKIIVSRDQEKIKEKINNLVHAIDFQEEAQRTQVHIQKQLLQKKAEMHTVTTTHTAHTFAFEKELHTLREKILFTHDGAIARTTVCVNEKEQIQKKKIVLQEQMNLSMREFTVLESHIIRDGAEEAYHDKRCRLLTLLDAKKTHKKREYDALCAKRTLLRGQSHSSCPLCLQGLTEQLRTELVARISEQIAQMELWIKRVQSIKSKLREDSQKYEKQKLYAVKRVEERERIFHQLQQLILKKEQLEKQYEERTQEIELLQLQVEQCKKKMRELEETWTTRIVTIEHCLSESCITFQILHKELEQLQTELQKNSYSEQRYKAEKKELEELRTLLYSHTDQLLLLEQRQEKRANIITQLTELKQLRLREEKLTTDRQQLRVVQNKQQICMEQLRVQETVKKELSREKERLLEEKGHLERQKNEHARQEQEQRTDAALCTTLQETVRTYTAIIEATGKDGIQALLIEQAIPEIEYEANQLLSRLTNNQMQIIIESLKDLKSGKTKETLDIKVSDALGIRPYELFSGGEAFRIDLAIRIAISKLLAHRAGTTLQTLIIDEGFGSQDEEGLALIIEALYKIQDDFQKIIVVSHLPIIKEQFPVHFVVQKTFSGSTISVVQQ